VYKLIDSGHFQKLEQVGPWRIVRPAAQAVWNPRLREMTDGEVLDARAWTQADAIFTRFSGGDGRWEIRSRKLPESWSIPIPYVGQMIIKLTDFGHLGIFPEQHRNWKKLSEIIQGTTHTGSTPFQVLNLFAYTGGSTLACARAGAHVTHVDASKTSVTWARENSEASGLGKAPIRWIVDDVSKFVAREVRRGSQYHGIILDPPSYGRGPKGETWKIEDMLPELLVQLKQILAPNFRFVLLSSHSAGYTPLSLTNLVGDLWPFSKGGDRQVVAEEMVVYESPSLDPKEMSKDGGEEGRALPSGASCLFVNGPHRDN
jgi:23S rRNA (cytosine1962-C5)-methyltransferase